MTPFERGVRKEILRNDKWTCQAEDCLTEALTGRKAQWKRGWNVQAAHYPELHQREVDYNPDHGRCLCVSCHIQEEIERGNYNGARLLHSGHTIRNTNWIEKHGGQDEKMPLEWYYDYANTDESGREGLIDIARETFGY